MPIPLHGQVKPGTLVSIVLKQDQRTGRQVQGSVSQVLTRGNHPRGVKVRLADGRIGRVQQLVGANTQSTSQNTAHYTRRMADHNPWATNESQGNPYQNSNQYSQQQQAHQSGGHPQQRFYDQQQSYQPQQPYSQQYQQNTSSAQDYYNPPPQQQQADFNAWSDSTGNPPLPARNPAHTASVPQRTSRNDTDELLASQPDRAEQMEHMQAYEATANMSVDDRNRAQLEKEFPDVDGSLVAALYGDTKDLSATRELLQELNRGS